MTRAALLFTVSGVLGALAFPPAGLDLLIFVALAPFFAASAGRPRFRVALLFGLAWFGVGIAWMIPLSLWEYGPLVVVLALYTAGAVVYARRRPDPNPEVFGYHEIFHLLVIAAAAVQYAAVAIYALPAA